MKIVWKAVHQNDARFVACILSGINAMLITPDNVFYEVHVRSETQFVLMCENASGYIAHLLRETCLILLTLQNREGPGQGARPGGQRHLPDKRAIRRIAYTPSKKFARLQIGSAGYFFGLTRHL